MMLEVFQKRWIGELLDDLIDTISPGEHVTVSGVFRMSESDESKYIMSY